MQLPTITDSILSGNSASTLLWGAIVSFDTIIMTSMHVILDAPDGQLRTAQLSRDSDQVAVQARRRGRDDQ